MIKYVFDLDGTLCTNTYGDYENAKPINSRIKIVNELYKNGNFIVICTARGMGSSQNNKAIAEEKWRDLTEQQLRNWGVLHHELHLGKPAGDIYIDDKGTPDSAFFRDSIDE